MASQESSGEVKLRELYQAANGFSQRLEEFKAKKESYVQKANQHDEFSENLLRDGKGDKAAAHQNKRDQYIERVDEATEKIKILTEKYASIMHTIEQRAILDEQSEVVQTLTEVVHTLTHAPDVRVLESSNANKLGFANKVKTDNKKQNFPFRMSIFKKLHLARKKYSISCRVVQK